MPPVMLCEVRMAKPRWSIAAGGVLNSGAAAVALRQAGSWLSHQIKERQVAFGQVGDLGRPVIHLHVDVRVIIGMPRRIVVVVPEALQIRRQAAGTRTGNQQVTTVLKQQLLQSGINVCLTASSLALVGRQRGLLGGGFAQVERDAVEQRMKILYVRGLERRRNFLRRRVNLCRHARVRVFAAIIRGVIHRVIRARRDNQREAVAILEFERRAVGLQRAAVRQHDQLRLVFQAVVERARKRPGGPCPATVCAPCESFNSMLPV